MVILTYHHFYSDCSTSITNDNTHKMCFII